MNKDNRYNTVTADNSNDGPKALEESPSFEKNFIPASIRKINFAEPSEKDLATLSDIVPACFIERYGKYEGITENAEKFKTGFSFLRQEEYAKAIEDEEGEDTPGVFILSKHRAFINKDAARGEADFDFTTFLHEAHHFFSIENGAGFNTDSSSFAYSDEIYENPELSELLDAGVTALCEGSTQMFAVNMHHDLNFDFYNNTYPIETEFARGLRDIIGWEKFEEIYFTMPLEEIRLRVESLSVPPDEEIGEDYINGKFGWMLVELGDRVKYCRDILSKYKDTPNIADMDSISDDDRGEIYATIDEFLSEFNDYVHQFDAEQA